MFRFLVVPFLTAFCLGLLVGPASAQELKRERKSAYTMLVHRLEEAIKVCKRNKLQMERKRVSDLLLRFDKENPYALLGAGYRKGRGGVWNPPRSSKSFVDAEAPDELANVRESVREAMAEFVLRLEKLLDLADLTDADLNRISSDIVAVDPRNKRLRRVRGELGEVYFGGKWILEETMSGLDGRAFLREVREDARAQSRYEGEVLEVNTMGLTWNLATPAGGQVFVTGDAEEARELAEIVDTVALVFGWFFGQRAEYPSRCRFFLMTTAEKDAFLDKHPNIGAANKAQFDGLELSGIQGTSDQAFFADSSEQRADGLVRM